MVAAPPTIAARSPLAGLALPSHAGVRICERPLVSLVEMASWPDCRAEVDSALAREGLPPMPDPCRTATGGGTTIMDAGPFRALIDSDREGLIATLRPHILASIGTVTDLSHARICVELSGPRCRWVLAKGVSLDLHDSAFPRSAVAFTEVAHIAVVLRRVADETYALYPSRGFARSLVAWLDAAAAPDGGPRAT